MPEEKTAAGSISFGEEFDKSGFDLIDDGKYEVVIEKVEPKESKKGNKYLNVVFKIRSDVDQEFKNRKLFYRINAKEGDPTGYDFNRLNKIIITQPNYKKYFLDIDEVLQYLVGLHLVITVETTFDEYSSQDRNNVKDWAFEKSVWDMQDHPAPIVEEHTETLKADLPDDDKLPWL